MALFTRAPEKSATKDRDSAQANVGRLALKLHDAELAVVATKQAAQRAALDGDDAALDAAEAAERAALHRHGTLAAASGEAGKMLAFLEEQIATMEDQKLRKATAAEIAALADELVEVAAGFDASVAALAGVCNRALAVSMELNGMAVFAAASRTEVAAAIPVVVEVLRQHGRAVLNHSAPAMLATAEAPFVPTIPVKPVTTRLFATRAVRWVDSSGETKLSRKWVDVDLPPETAERALKSGVCLPLDHPMRRTHLNQSPAHVDPSWCTSLDVDDTEVAQPSLAEPEPIFTPIDRGPVFKLRVAAGGAS
jgi:hypothetical protein